MLLRLDYIGLSLDLVNRCHNYHVKVYIQVELITVSLRDAVADGQNVAARDNMAYAKAAIDAIKQLAADVEIPAGLTQLGAKEEDFDTLAGNAL